MLSYPSPSPGVCSDLCPLSRWCHPTISSSVTPFSPCPQSFPASGSVPTSRLFTSGGQSIGVSASASVLPMNIQGWFPLRWTGWISVQSKGLPRAFCSTTAWSLSSSALSLLHGPALTPTHDHWKSHSLDRTDACWQSDVSASHTLSRFVTAFLPRNKHLLLTYSNSLWVYHVLGYTSY